MADIIRDAIVNLLMPTLKAKASQQVVYTRGSRSVTVAATFGQKLLRQHDQFGGVRIEWTDLDFIIDAADLHFDDGIPLTPENNDKIYLTLDSGDVQVYEVLPFGNEAAWRWSGTNDLLFRIHTKNVKTIKATP